MTEPRWLALIHILAIHSDQVQAHGGSLGLRDRGLLESALDRPRNRFHYEAGADLPALAAAYGFGLAKNHPFVDDNKRVAFQAMYLFLGLNGFRIEAPEEEVVATILSLAGGDLDEPGLAAWLRQRITPRKCELLATKAAVQLGPTQLEDLLQLGSHSEVDRFRVESGIGRFSKVSPA